MNYKRGVRRLNRLGDVKPLRLVIGASGVCDKGWINTDVEYLDLLNPEHWEAYFRKNSIDAILAEHVWEHLEIDKAIEAANRCFEYLRPGGYLRVAVPDGYHPDQDYIQYVKPGENGVGENDHKVLYTHVTLADVFEQAGFRISLLEYFDAAAEFHYVDWNPGMGKIHRSRRFDKRNMDGRLIYTSLILDAFKDK